MVILLSKRRFRRAHIHFQAKIRDRLLHVRVTLGSSSIDIVAVYQHVWALKASEPLDSLLHRRRRVWERLQSLLGRLLRRNRLIVFSTVTLRWTWSTSPAFRFQPGSGGQPLCAEHLARTQIDYTLVPRDQAPSNARQALLSRWHVERRR